MLPGCGCRERGGEEEGWSKMEGGEPVGKPQVATCKRLCIADNTIVNSRETITVALTHLWFPLSL